MCHWGARRGESRNSKAGCRELGALISKPRIPEELCCDLDRAGLGREAARGAELNLPDSSRHLHCAMRVLPLNSPVPLKVPCPIAMLGSSQTTKGES